MPYSFFHRDLSWLSFNERVLQEAGRPEVPLFERIRFLSIYSSNLDEFYRVRIPTLMAISRLKKETQEETAETRETGHYLSQINQRIERQQQLFGTILRQQLLPALQQTGNELLYHTALPESILPAINHYFFAQVLCFLQPQWLKDINGHFFPANNQLYLFVLLEKEQKEKRVIVNIPTDAVPRFFSVEKDGRHYIVFLEDIIRHNLPALFRGYTVKGAWNFKATRDAELNLQDEYQGDLADKIEAQLTKRDMGIATRFLYEPGIPLRAFKALVQALNLSSANMVEGGYYHNLKDFAGLPLTGKAYYTPMPAVQAIQPATGSLLDDILVQDRILHVPYQSYDAVLRFFSEAATDPDVEEINVTLYRVAKDSRIVSALISAAKNGKKVVVFVELKARFDEENNLKWAKKMKAAGVQIIYSIPGLKVHAKTALVKRRRQQRMEYLCLLATGNFNESTARFYTDHILFTAHPAFGRELDLLFIFLSYRKSAHKYPMLHFEHLLVAQFNLQQRFLELIEREIQHVREGKPASIIIKLNNLEERTLISKLYDASNAGVQVQLIVRSICCLIPGVPGMSENIRITRIVDRYLEHGRVFIFGNNNDPLVFLGSADWMNRNIYRRVEVCFPVYQPVIKQQLLDIIRIQLNDTLQAVVLDEQMNNHPVVQEERQPQASQQTIYQMLLSRQSGI
jgi:polyphosphate kinase